MPTPFVCVQIKDPIGPRQTAAIWQAGEGGTAGRAFRGFFFFLCCLKLKISQFNSSTFFFFKTAAGSQVLFLQEIGRKKKINQESGGCVRLFWTFKGKRWKSPFGKQIGWNRALLVIAGLLPSHKLSASGSAAPTNRTLTRGKELMSVKRSLWTRRLNFS